MKAKDAIFGWRWRTIFLFHFVSPPKKGKRQSATIPRATRESGITVSSQPSAVLRDVK
jgi:hypothetical protein